MGENSNFSINNIDVPTNSDITVTFSPVLGTQHYTYTVYKNNIVEIENQVLNAEAKTITFKDTGTYKIVLNMVDSNNKTTTVQSGNYLIDKEPPVIQVDKTVLKIAQDDEIVQNVLAYDNYDGDVTSKVTSNINTLNTNELGTQKLIYTVSDRAGNETSQVVDVEIINNDYTLIVIQMFLIICLLFLTLIVFRFKKLLKLEKRIDQYALSPKKGHSTSLMDIFVSQYQKLNSKLANILEKSVFAGKYAKKLDKYTAISENHKTGMNILALKIIMALLLLLVAFISDVVQMKLMEIYEIGLPLLVGFFLPDIVYFVKYKAYKRIIENDLLSAIIIMNNAFKAGKNITQAITIVGEELTGVIANEFKKMSLELSYGLDIEIIFKRFADRVKIDEVNYLTASLTVLNKTGGDIVEVFSSIEKTLFDKKKLRLELASLTGSSRLIVYILLAIPFIFVLMISIISPSYFLPFVTTDLGLILLGLMIIYYTLFVIVVRRIMKVVI